VVLYERALALTPGRGRVVANMARALEASGQADRVGPLLARAGQPDAKEAAQAIFDLADLAERRGQADRVREALKQILRLNPNHAEAALRLGRILVAEGKIKEAGDYFRVVVNQGELRALNAFRAFDLVQPLLSAGHMIEADLATRRAIELDSSRAYVWYYSAFVGWVEGRAEVSVERARRAIALDPGLAVSYQTAGCALADLNLRSEALASQRREVFLTPDDILAHWFFGCALHAAGRLNDALESYGRCFENDPNNGWGWLGTANVLHDLDRLDDAEIAAGRAVDGAPGLCWAWIARGSVAHSRGHFQQAEADFQRAAETDALMWPFGQLNLAVAFADEGRFDEAGACLSRVGPNRIGALWGAAIQTEINRRSRSGAIATDISAVPEDNQPMPHYFGGNKRIRRFLESAINAK